MPNFIFGDLIDNHRPFGKSKPPYVFYTLLAPFIFLLVSINPIIPIVKHNGE